MKQMAVRGVRGRMGGALAERAICGYHLCFRFPDSHADHQFFYSLHDCMLSRRESEGAAKHRRVEPGSIF